MLSLARKLAERGCAVVLISHNLVDVFAVADRMVVFRRGRKIAERRREATDTDEIVSLITGAHPDARALGSPWPETTMRVDSPQHWSNMPMKRWTGTLAGAALLAAAMPAAGAESGATDRLLCRRSSASPISMPWRRAGRRRRTRSASNSSIWDRSTPIPVDQLADRSESDRSRCWRYRRQRARRVQALPLSSRLPRRRASSSSRPTAMPLSRVAPSM